MDVRSIIAEIDAEISKLQGVRATLTGLSGSTAGTSAVPVKTGRRGRPKGSKNAQKTDAAVAAKPAKSAKKSAKRKLSPEGRKRIAEAMKRRWAERRKETAK